MIEEKRIEQITRLTAEHFRSFGGGKEVKDGNPFAEAIKNYPATFAAGIKIEDVVRFVLSIEDQC